MDSIPHPTGSRVGDRVARFVRPLIDAKLLSTKLKHLRHEWLGIQSAVGIESSQNLGFAANLHEFTGAQIQCNVMFRNALSHPPYPFVLTDTLNRSSKLFCQTNMKNPFTWELP